MRSSDGTDGRLNLQKWAWRCSSSVPPSMSENIIGMSAITEKHSNLCRRLLWFHVEAKWMWEPMFLFLYSCPAAADLFRFTCVPTLFVAFFFPSDRKLLVHFCSTWWCELAGRRMTTYPSLKRAAEPGHRESAVQHCIDWAPCWTCGEKRDQMYAQAAIQRFTACKYGLFLFHL